jgi:phytoene dehydrogenase-like protein
MVMAERRPVIVVGAGLAGLNCARLLWQRGRDVIVLEAGDTPGGRVRTEVTSDGFVLDRGFQVLFTAYPALQRALDLRRLDLRLFDSGAAIATQHGPVFLRDPLRHPRATLPALSSRVLTWSDRLRLLRLAVALVTSRWDGAREVPDGGLSNEQDLYAAGFSAGFIDAFFRPFLSGVRLQRDLSTSAGVGRFDLQMLVRGRAALPASGIYALPMMLAATLPPAALRLNSPVIALLRDGLRAVGVRTPEGEVRGSAVVVATDGATAAHLTGLPAPRVTLGSTTVYLAGQDRPYRQKLLVLNAHPDPFVNDTTLLTNVAPEYAPHGWHLLAAHVLDAVELDDATLDRRVRADLARLFPHVDFARWRTLRITRTPCSQFAQPPGARTILPTRTQLDGLYLSGEITEDSSINGAVRSGEAAARAVLTDQLQRT